ncbi:type IV inositol polyphosphate 5-phosphatase 9-like [Neltuma alba]|uniref:type IV inositol polyphosphate 5-phosphatase 9-like n=1 Tax=Neltuma alba TaxID=207710 RepID=UPI0010A45E37|nr:type IV inositol polyphosphate 5-phosphatase 9-like [Prosopis alba]
MPPKQGEVMWPRLVASKILNKRLGSSNFVADYSTNLEPLLGFTTIDDHSTLGSKTNNLDDLKETQKYKIFASTWNVGGLAPDKDLNIDDLLETSGTNCDIYVLGFQEIVPLKASNVLGSENRKISMKWNSLIREALNKRTGGRTDMVGNNIDENNNSNKNNEVEEMGNPAQYNKIAPQDFQCIISKQMVGILISVWVRRHLRPFVQHQSVSCVGCGIIGCLGNKGSVSVRFQLHETSFCFVCSHLASGGREGDEKLRNSNVSEIFSRTSFPRGGPLLDLPKKILHHDLVILLGDLNYRIALPEETTRLLVESKHWDSLLENDQLRTELMSGSMLRGWHEGTIRFAPTYKYCPNSDVYYGCFYHGKGAQKRRAPAWCDRIIWYGKGLKQLQYTRSESMLSDHRPVKAMFSAEVKVLPTLKNLHSLFLSERFEQLKSHIQVSSTDELLCKTQTSFRL